MCYNLVPRVSLEGERKRPGLSLPLQRDPGNEVVCARVLIFALNLTKSHDWQEYKFFFPGGEGGGGGLIPTIPKVRKSELESEYLIPSSVHNRLRS